MPCGRACASGSAARQACLEQAAAEVEEAEEAEQAEAEVSCEACVLGSAVFPNSSLPADLAMRSAEMRSGMARPAAMEE